ncbi:uncharacterized protein LOC127284490 [Leptopilina boulardi]|uniref:uncharacterized protein LOC127284490 n=1 Tax=Leptopilina boulardi TaxID=63433 RepID=UPI0021F5D439|nr:uncharacterized protein LOC127284490 [Leptopilina boulardi]
MLYRVLYVIINIFTLFQFLFGESIITKNEKLPDIELQTCVDSFVIHRDKIIRTLDSQEMGAKYLTEIDVNSENECIKFCCVTDQCDVFIFEEKKPGSCYLFHCGPPQDFKCKFTDHANYSSAVLTNYKPPTVLQLEEQVRKTPEHELKSLRKQTNPGLKEYSYNELPAVAATQITKTSTVTSPAPVKIECSRNQFECRTSGDCIAIYNVCDGIPQCPDGSDEGAELHCPTEKPSPTSPPVIEQKPMLPSLPDVLRYQQMLQHHKSYAPMYGHVQESNSKSWQSSGSTHQGIPPQQQNLPYLADQDNPSQHTNFGSQNYPWNYQPYYDQNKENFGGYNYHEQNNPVYEQQSHIFNHKRPGIIDENPSDGGVYTDQNRQFLPYYQQSNHESWQEKQPPQPSVPQLEQHIEPEVSQEKTKSTTTPQPCKISGKDTNVTKIDDSHIIKNNGKNTKIVDKSQNNEDSLKTKSIVKAETNIKIIEINKDSKVDHKISEEQLKETKKESLVAQHFRHNNSVNENLRPKGAVISLVLGLSVSAVMAILIACRLRVVRRRGRRGHEPYAHDADYLVNGMYL